MIYLMSKRLAAKAANIICQERLGVQNIKG